LACGRNAKRLFKRCQGGSSESAPYAAAVQGKNPERNPIGHAAPDKRQSLQLAANGIDEAANVFFERKRLVGVFIPAILQGSNDLFMIPNVVPRRSAKPA
jgi:hypothetical protein